MAARIAAYIADIEKGLEEPRKRTDEYPDAGRVWIGSG